MSSINVEVLSSGVAVVKIDLPGEKLNILSTPLMTELDAAVDSLLVQAEAGKIAGVVFISGKQDNFFAGANLDEIMALQKQPAALAYEATLKGKAIFAKIARLPNTVAAINGVCLGGGTELALSCRFRLLSDSRSTKLGLPEVGLGFLPGWGGTVRLTKLVGPVDAMEMILQPLKSWDSKKCWRTGLADEVVPADRLFDRAVEVALGAEPKRATPTLKQRVVRSLMSTRGNRLAQCGGSLVALIAGWFLLGWWGVAAGVIASLALHAPQIARKVLTIFAGKQIAAETRGNYPAPPAAFKVIMASLTKPADVAFDMESQAFAKLAVTPVSRNLVGIFFATQESKKAPDGVKPLEVKTVGVLGAGVMGAGIAQAALYAGYNVVLYDNMARALMNAGIPVTNYDKVAREGLEKGLKTIQGLFDGLVEKKKMTKEEAAEKMALLVPTTEYAPLVNCELIFEAISEDMRAKKGAIAELENVFKAKAGGQKVPASTVVSGADLLRWLFASNTSSLSLGEMSADALAPQDIGGLHFFNPVHKMPLVEVVSSGKTAPEVIATFKAVAAKLGKTAVTTADSPGFIVNRLLVPYLLESIRLMEAGVPLADIDDAMKRFGLPMGPLALMDEVGLDICAKVLHVLHDSFGERLAPPAILEFIRQNKLLGKKGGRGIYLYDNSGKRLGFNPDLLAALPPQTNKKSRGEIQDRLVLVMVNEAALALDQGVVNDPSQLDLATIMGSGFPPFRGGVFRYADAVGVRAVVQKLQWLSQVAGDNYKPAPLLLSKAASGESFYA